MEVAGGVCARSCTSFPGGTLCRRLRLSCPVRVDLVLPLQARELLRSSEQLEL